MYIYTYTCTLEKANENLKPNTSRLTGTVSADDTDMARNCIDANEKKLNNLKSHSRVSFRYYMYGSINTLVKTLATS